MGSGIGSGNGMTHGLGQESAFVAVESSLKIIGKIQSGALSG
jgi:hypothetical protein